MTPLHITAFLAAPLLFPSLSPVAVWIGLGSVAVCLAVLATADSDLGDCEAGIRADEARDWLARMETRRVG